ncbi:hypothetical protein M8756_10430 [Lutimaribacter sp. EGI FJ00015]|uniref:Uncharacterized protein n=1 Tax=Lutimaribacter degradans TaxID=2945989 RepID=A0ACC5ZXA9_9RHOB|nr:hypothetical protein [Lutimaribacter sp. EGI FJ00013]MCM2562563.1 hypothetical protein [Lutimaribacter sp. EGI FJ00013]MCO0613720.1 hypothetical protein [Lutimaribacter sp. EGI FJ00015]MCO0636797.1 hypothetical protein [Lutimaribacter sp. EGI FJ00014]
MVQQSFHDRIARINQKHGRAEILIGPAETNGPRGAPNGVAAAAVAPRRQDTGVIKLMMVAMLMVPVGMAIGLMTTQFLDPAMSPGAANYLPLMVFVLLAHLGLLTGAITAIFARFRMKVLNYALLFVFAGHGIATATLAAMVQ